MSLKVYQYDNCSTCRKALRFLEDRGVAFKKLDIRETPPSRAELRLMLKNLRREARRMFNTSGRDYRAMGLKDTIGTMSEDEIIELLHSNGNLIRRPFVIKGNFTLIGFFEEVWDAKFPT